MSFVAGLVAYLIFATEWRMHFTLLNATRKAPAVVENSSSEKVMSLSTVSCNSPEYDVPWPFGQCAGATRPQAKSLTSALTYGLCNQGKFASYLARMVQRLEELKRAECSELVVYGAAFGDKFVNLLKTSDGKNRSASSYRPLPPLKPLPRSHSLRSPRPPFPRPLLFLCPPLPGPL